MKKNKKVFLAIDTNNISIAKKIIFDSKTSKLKIGYKFGLEFFNSKKGRNFISKLKKKTIFIDLKLNDIPKTMSATLMALKDLRINYFTVHISSGLKALKEVKKISGKTKIVGVTTLTSLDSKDLQSIGFSRSVKSLVLYQTKIAKKANLDAIVCSPHEVENVKKIFKGEVITPGIRLNENKNDQKRIMSPYRAFLKGSDWLVIGRSITKGNIKKNLKKLLDNLYL
tara:strand:- start:2148 stop:2825 length:678 start_codon:yes stop_codon:yes gene_type:complete